MKKPALEEMREGEGVLLALSGGADSVALFLLLWEQARAGRIRLGCAHMEHGIRGEASAEDMRFVRALCEERGVPLSVERVDIPSLAAQKGMGLEQAAREERYRFLRDVCARTGMDEIALAHHMRDQCETSLMHLLRGSGLGGVSGMRVRGEGLWRPLLHASKEELVEFLLSEGQAWREDATNRENDNPRNILRNRALPAMEAAYPGCVRAVARFADIARDEDDFMDAQSRAFLRENAREMPFGWQVLRQDAHPAVLRRALRMLASGADWEETERLRQTAQGLFGPVTQTKGWTAERANGRLYLIRSDARPPAGERTLEEAFGAVPCAPVPVRDDPFRQALNRDALRGAVARVRRPGDVIAPLGMAGKKSLSDYMIDKKLDRPLRDYLPLAAKGSEILWAPGLGISRKAALTDGCEAVLLTYRK